VLTCADIYLKLNLKLFRWYSADVCRRAEIQDVQKPGGVDAAEEDLWIYIYKVYVCIYILYTHTHTHTHTPTDVYRCI
jgi:hypothetical protein